MVGASVLAYNGIYVVCRSISAATYLKGSSLPEVRSRLLYSLAALVPSAPGVAAQAMYLSLGSARGSFQNMHARDSYVSMHAVPYLQDALRCIRYIMLLLQIALQLLATV
jgi:hypothetical protein